VTGALIEGHGSCHGPDQESAKLSATATSQTATAKVIRSIRLLKGSQIVRYALAGCCIDCPSDKLSDTTIPGEHGGQISHVAIA
jgi:hypothetical protein